MNVYRKGVTLGLVAIGVAGALAGGARIAAAAPGPISATAATAAQPFTSGHMPGMVSGMPGMAVGTHGMGFGGSSAMDRVGSYLGLSQSDLRVQLQAGKSLADIATTQGRSVSGLEAVMLTAVRSNLDAQTALTADQEAAILTEATTHIHSMVTTTHPSGMDTTVMGGRMRS